MQAHIEGGGLVAIPKPVQEQMGLRPGDKVDFDLEAGNRLVMRKADSSASDQASPLAPDRFERARGSAGPGPTTDEIMTFLRGDPAE